MKYPVTKLILSSAMCVFFLCGCVQVQQSTQTAAAQTVLAADCVARYYKADESAYLTYQQHRFVPSHGQLHVISNEPTGPLEYSLQQDVFTGMKKKDATLPDLPQSFFNQALATTVFYAMCAHGALLDVRQMTSEEPVKILGQWYRPFVPSWPRDRFSVTLLQNQDTQRIDLVKISEDTGTEWLSESSNFRYNKDLKTSLPQAVDVFDISEGIASKRLIAQFEYKNFQASINSESKKENSAVEQ